MPCRCEGYKTNEHHQIDNLTQMLCWLYGEAIQKGVVVYGKHSKLHSWWEHHYAADTGRVYYNMLQFLEDMDEDCVLGYPAERLADYFIAAADKVHPVSSWHQAWFSDLATKAVEEFTTAFKLKQTAKAKLTPEERKILGL